MLSVKLFHVAPFVRVFAHPQGTVAVAPDFTFQKTVFPIDGGVVLLNVTSSKLLQPENALLPMLVTLLGIVMPVRAVQPINACSSMLVPKLVGKVTLVKFVQPRNAL